MNRDIEKHLWDYVQKNCLPRHSNLVFPDDENLFESGILDSAGLVSLVGYVEKTFDISIPDEDLLPENFMSIKAIADYIRTWQQRHRQAIKMEV